MIQSDKYIKDAFDLQWIKRIAIMHGLEDKGLASLIKSNFYYLTSIFLVLISLQVSGQSLNYYQQLAAQNNPSIKAQYKEFEAAMEKVPQVSSLPDPTFTFGYFISPVETRVGPQRARLSLTQLFPWFGTLKDQKEAATLDAEAKFQAFIEAKNKLYYDVAAAYYPLYELEKWQNIERQNIEVLESYKAIATSRFQNGKGALVDALRADIMLNEAKTNLSILKKREKPLITRFNELLNTDTITAITISDSLALPSDLSVSDSLANHPLLKELELRERSYERKALSAKKQSLPKIGAGLDYVIVGDREDMTVADNGKDVLMPMVTLSLPIFRGKYNAAIKEAELLQEATVLRREATANSLRSQYESTHFELQKQADLVQLFEQQITETKRTLKLLFSAYENRETDFEEILNTRQKLLKYQKQKASAEAQYFIEQTKLNYLTSNPSDQ